jgi:hypothetical protein
MAIVFDLKEEKRMAWKEIFFTCVDRWAKVFVSIKVTAAKHSTRL